MKSLSLTVLAVLFMTSAYAEDSKPAQTSKALTPTTVPTTPPKVKYRTAKDVSFEELLIQGELKRPEITVVTGNAQQGTDGLLRLREDFLDRIAADFGEKTLGEKSQ